jgi:hypothetical protein
VRQRNQTGYTLTVTPADGSPAFEVAAGESVDHPDLITGCVSEEPPVPPSDAGTSTGTATGGETTTKTTTTKTQRAADGGDTK